MDEASLGGEEFYPDLIDKAVSSHADGPGTIRCSTGTSGRPWHRPSSSWTERLQLGSRHVDDAEAAMLAVVAHDVDEEWLEEC
jgi:hypothetical protein